MRLTKFEVCENATTAVDLATDCWLLVLH